MDCANLPATILAAHHLDNSYHHHPDVHMHPQSPEPIGLDDTIEFATYSRFSFSGERGVDPLALLARTAATSTPLPTPAAPALRASDAPTAAATPPPARRARAFTSHGAVTRDGAYTSRHPALQLLLADPRPLRGDALLRPKTTVYALAALAVFDQPYHPLHPQLWGLQTKEESAQIVLRIQAMTPCPISHPYIRRWSSTAAILVDLDANHAAIATSHPRTWACLTGQSTSEEWAVPERRGNWPRKRKAKDTGKTAGAKKARTKNGKGKAREEPAEEAQAQTGLRAPSVPLAERAIAPLPRRSPRGQATTPAPSPMCAGTSLPALTPSPASSPAPQTPAAPPGDLPVIVVTSPCSPRMSHVRSVSTASTETAVSAHSEKTAVGVQEAEPKAKDVAEDDVAMDAEAAEDAESEAPAKPRRTSRPRKEAMKLKAADRVEEVKKSAGRTRRAPAKKDNVKAAPKRKVTRAKKAAA